MGHIRRGAALAIAASLVFGVSCGSEVGDDGLPTHCGRTVYKVVDHFIDPEDGRSISFEDAVGEQLRADLPRLRFRFPSTAPGGLSDDTNRVQTLQISDVAEGRRATLKNANGIRMLSVTAGEYDGSWVVDNVEVCRSMTKKFANS